MNVNLSAWCWLGLTVLSVAASVGSHYYPSFCLSIIALTLAETPTVGGIVKGHINTIVII